MIPHLIHSSLPVLAEADPIALFRDMGFVSFLGYALAAWLLYGKLMERRDAKDAREEAAREAAKTRAVRLMPTPLQVTEAKEWATEEDLNRMEADLKREIKESEMRADQKTKLLFKKSDQVHAHIESIQDTILKAGDVRLEAITGQVNALASVLGEKVTNIALKCAGQHEAIENLKTETYKLWSQKADKKPHA